MSNTYKVFVAGIVVSVILIGVTFADFDRDGKSDVFTVRFSGDLDWYEAIVQQWRTVEYKSTIASDVNGVVVFDVEGDGKDEVLFGRRTAGNILTLLQQNGLDNGFTATGVNVTSMPPVVAGEVDGDGKGDFFTIDGGGQMFWFEWSGIGTTFISHDRFLYSTAKCAAVGDLDHSGGNNDVLVCRFGWALQWYEATADNSMTCQGTWSRDDTRTVTAMAMGDLDKNGFTDVFLVTTDGSFGKCISWREFPLDEYGYITDISWRGRVIGDFVDVAVADYDRSGRKTLIGTLADGTQRWFIARDAGGLIEVNGNGFTTSTTEIAVSQTQSSFDVPDICNGAGYIEGDINHDCKVDWLDVNVLATNWLK